MTKFDRVLVVLWIVVTVAIAVLALSAPVATAAPAPRAVVTESYQIAETYWNRRHVDPCDGRIVQRRNPRFARIAGDGTALAAGYIGPFPDGDPYCLVVLNAETHWQYEATTLSRWNNDPITAANEYICAVVVHERGHNAGFEHRTRPSIMQPYFVWRSQIPRACRVAF